MTARVVLVAGIAVAGFVPAVASAQPASPVERPAAAGPAAADTTVAGTAAALPAPGGQAGGLVHSLPRLLAAPADATEGDASPWPGAGAVETLPAWRWQNVVLDSDASGIFDVARNIPSVLGGLLLLAANFIWQILLWILRFAIQGSGDLLLYSAGPINKAVGTLANGAWIVALPLVAWLVWKVVAAWTGRGDLGQAVRTAVRGILVIGLIGVIGQASSVAAQDWTGAPLDALPAAVAACEARAAAEPDSGQASVVRQACLDEAQSSFDAGSDRAVMEAQLTAPMTLPWLASTITSAASDLAGAVGKAGDLLPLGPGPQATSTDTPSCAPYLGMLHSGYQQANGSDGTSGTMSTLSRLWENTQYQYWSAAAFGQPGYGQDLPGRTMCRFAEMVNARSAAEQQTIESYAQAQSGGTSIPAPGAATIPVFGPFPDYSVRDARLAMTAWAACQNVAGTWQAGRGFENAMAADKISQDCTQAFTGTELPSTTASQLASSASSAAGVFGPAVDALGRAVGVSDVPLAELYGQSGKYLVDEVAADKRESTQAAMSWISGYRGLNGGDRMLQGMLALATSVMFLLTLGQLGLGLFLAQFMLVILLMALPVILVIWALGMDRRARGLARLTLTLLFAQVFFVTLLTAIIVLSGLMQRLATAVTGSMPGTGLLRGILYGISPLIAFWLVKRLAGMLGLSNIMSFSGAVGFVAGSALLSTRDPQTGGPSRARAWAGGKGQHRAGLDSTSPQRPMRPAAGRFAPGFPKSATADTAAKAAAGPRSWTRASLKDKEAHERRASRRSGYQDAVDKLSSSSRMDPSKGERQKNLGAKLSDAGLGLSRWQGRASRVGSFLSGESGRAAGMAARDKMRSGGTLSRRRRRPMPEALADAAAVAEGVLNDAIGAQVRRPGYVTKDEARHAEVAGRQRRASLVNSGKVTSLNAQRAAVASGLDSAAVAWLDYSEDFRGFSSPSDLRGYRAGLADAAEVRASDVVVGYSGLGAVGWRDRESMRSLSPQALQDPGLWLSAEYGARRDGESADVYLARRYATLMEAGLMTRSGQPVDALEVIGLGSAGPDRDARVQAWLDGRSDRILDEAVLNLKNANSAAVIRASQAAAEWAQRRLEALERHGEQQMSDLVEAYSAASATAPDMTAALEASRERIQQQLQEHRGLVMEFQSQASEQARQAVLESFAGVDQAIQRFRADVADVEVTRQVIAMGAVGSEAEVEAFLDAGAKDMEALVRQLEELEAKAAAAAFGAGIDELNQAVERMAGQVQAQVARTGELVRERLAHSADRDDLDLAQLRRHAGSEPMVSVRDMVEGTGALAFP